MHPAPSSRQERDDHVTHSSVPAAHAEQFTDFPSGMPTGTGANR